MNRICTTCGNYFSGRKTSNRCSRCRLKWYNRMYYKLHKKKKIDKIERFNVLMEKGRNDD